MTGYRLEPTIVGWRCDPADNSYMERLEITYEDGRTLHYPWGQSAALEFCNTPSAWPFVCHEPDYQPTGDGDTHHCVHCGLIVHPIKELR